MGWKEAHQAADLPREAGLFDQLEALVGEPVRLSATPSLYEDERGGHTPFDLVMLITIGHVTLGAPRLFGGSKVAWQRPVRDFRGYAVGLYRGGGPMYEVYCELNVGQVRFAFRTRDAAEVVAEYINSGILFAS